MKKTAFALLASAAFAAGSFAAEIPASIVWNPSDPLDITLEGNQTYDLWLNLSSGMKTRAVGANPFGLFINGNTGYGSFPSGINPWVNPIKSQLWTSGHQQGELWKISNGASGGPFPSGETIYYGGGSAVPNTDGGTLGAKAYAIGDVQTVTFQLSLGEAYGYTLFNGELPTLTLYDTSGGLIDTLTASYSDIIKKAYNGSMEMPPGSGVDEDVYINTFGLQWDLSSLGQEIGSFQVNWTAVQHAQLWSFRIDQTDEIYSDFIFDITSYWTGAGDEVWSSPDNWQGGSVASTVGKAVFGAGAGVELTADTTVGQITIRSDENFTIGSDNGSKLTAGLNITTEANGGPGDHTISADMVLPTTVTFDVGEDTTLAVSGDMSGVGFYKRGAGEFTISGNNSFSGNLVFAGGVTIVSGTNATTGASILDIKNARVVLQGDDRFSSAFGAKLAGTSTPGQTAYLQLGDENTGAVIQTLDSLNAVKPQYVKDLNPNPQTDPPVYVVGGSDEISTLTVKGGVYSGYLGGGGLHENNLSLVVDGNFTLQGTSTYVGDTVIKTGAVLQVNREAALSDGSNLVINGGLLALGSFSYLIPGGVNDNGILVTESVDTFTRALGTGAGEVRFDGGGGFRAVGGSKTVDLGGAGVLVTWGQDGFVADGSALILATDSSANTITFANAIDFGNASRTIQIDPNSAAALSGVLSGSGGLIKTGSGALLLSGLNTYTGVTRVEAGQLRVSQLGDAGGPSALGSTSNAASNLVLAGSTAALNYVGSANTSTDRLFTLAGAGGAIANDGAGSLHFTSTGAIAYDSAGAVEFQLRGTNNGANRFDPLITNNGAYAVSVRKSGDGAAANTGGYWILGNEANSYTGSTFINSGVLEVTKLANGGQTSSIGASTSAAANLKFFRGGLKYTGDGDSTDRLFSIAGYSANAPNTINASGTGALKFINTGAIGLTTSAGGATGAIGGGGWLVLSGTNAADNTLAAQIGGTSATASRLTKDGTGKWILSGVNSSYKGITEILGGTLGVYKLANGNANSSIGSSTSVAANLVINGGTLQYLGAGDSTDRRFTIGANGGGLDASGTGAVNFTDANAVTYAANNTARTLTLAGTSTANNTLSAAIGNAGTGATSLVKEGMGRWVLAGASANSYTGTTAVTGGTLQLNKTSGVTAISGNVAVHGGATLLISASEQVADTSSIALSGGVIQRGAGVSETFGNLTLTADSFLNYGGTAEDSFFKFGNLTLNGFTLEISNFLLGNKLQYNADNYAAGLSLADAFSFITSADREYGFSGGVFTVTAVPEPSITLLVILALGVLLLRPANRRRPVPAVGHRKACRGFTITGLLVTMALISLLIGLGMAGVGKAMDTVRKTREISAARTLIASYLLYIQDHNGELMIGHYEGTNPNMKANDTLPSGQRLDSTELHRYPYRLAPYFDYKTDGTVLVNKNASQIKSVFSGNMYLYGTTLCPALGINYYFVGGYMVDGEMVNPEETVTRMTQVHNPSSLLVFASAFSDISGTRIDGRYGVEPPNYRSTLWDQNLHVDARYGGKAVCAFLDGGVRMHTVDELRDMRLWSNNASREDDANYKVAVQGSSGVGGGGGGRR